MNFLGFAKNHLSDQTKENAMDVACSTYGSREWCIQGFDE